MKKIAVIYGELKNELHMRALRLLSEQIIEYTEEYPICIKCGEEERLSDYIKIYVGTKESNPYIAENSKVVLKYKEEYSISVKNGSVMIEGSDDTGVLYGCADFYNKYLVKAQYTDEFYTCWKNPFNDDLPDYELVAHPAVENRGIWTWGDVIYDYRSFIDNMVKLKMNSAIIWNDFPPINGKEMVDYAHASGIKVIWGYAWGWDTDCKAINVRAINDSIPEILEKYERDYLPLGGDGIYFQSFTEVHQENIDGILIAEAVTSFVNKASGMLLEKHPALELQFGLHAMSVSEKLEYIKNVDPRVRIVWEDCGAFPFNYMPNEINDFNKMMELTGKISVLRGDDDNFGVVTKGMICRNWNEFKHLKGPVYVGTSTKKFKAGKSEKCSKIWKYVQSIWLTNAGYAAEAVRLMANKKNGKLYITGLIEDGMFEDKVMLPAALYSEILWDPNQDIDKMINNVAQRSYVEFA